MFRAYPPPPPPPPPPCGMSSPAEGLGPEKIGFPLQKEKEDQQGIATLTKDIAPPSNFQNFTTSKIVPPTVKVSTDHNIERDFSSMRKTELQYLKDRAEASNAESLISRANTATIHPTRRLATNHAIPSPPKTISGSYLNHSTPNFISRSRPILGMEPPQSPSKSHPSNISPPKINSQKMIGRTEQPIVSKSENLYSSIKTDPVGHPTFSRDSNQGQVQVPPALESEDIQSITSTSPQVNITNPPSILSTPLSQTVTDPLQQDSTSLPLTTTSGSSKREALTSMWNVAPTPTSSVAEVDKDIDPLINDILKGRRASIPESITSTPSQAKESGTLRLVKELRKTKESLEQALKRETKLETQLMELKLQIMSSEDKQREPRSIVNEYRGQSNRRKRMKSPEPSVRKKNVDPLSDIRIANKAVESVDNLFESSLATYVVRKPYGGCEEMQCIFKNGEFSNNSGSIVTWISPVLTYLQNASVRDENTIEVAAKLKSDGSVLIVHGESCRHGTISVTPEGKENLEFKYFENVEELDGSLGKILYIDSEGNDREYSLDPIYDEASTIRESYCSNVFSAALALESTSPRSEVQGVGQVIISSPSSAQSLVSKPSMTDACVGTEDLPPVSETVDHKSTISSHSEPQIKVTITRAQGKQKATADSLDGNGIGSTDAVSAFIIFFISTMFSLVWFLLMLPIRLSKFALTCVVLLTLYQIAWIYISDESSIAMIDSKYNRY